MFWRLLLVVLLVANIAVGGWLIFGQHAQALPPATDPGVPELELLSAAPPSTAQAARTARAVAAAETLKPSGQCLAIGPFDTQVAMQQAVDAIRPHVPRVRFRQDQVTKTTGWWVYLPAVPTQQQALSAARALAADGVNDYYVITAGDRQNTISLGLFHDEDNARHRFDRIVALGFKPELKQREETLPQYWVDVAVPQAGGFNWRAWISAPAVAAQSAACF